LIGGSGGDCDGPSFFSQPERDGSSDATSTASD
jgi:hypothetical protein